MQESPRRKVTIIGAGFVGATTAFSLMAANLVDEIALIDVNEKLANSQVLDLRHGVSFWGHCDINVGDYSDIRDSSIVIIAAGANQKPGETRMDLIKKNTSIMAGIIPKVFKENPHVFLIMVTNPVDILTYQAIKLFPSKKKKIIGSGTVLDSSRLRFLLGEKLKINPQSVHAYIIGEHGDSEFPLWSTATIGNVALADFPGYSKKSVEKLFNQAKNAAYTIIEGKQATYYAIGSGVMRIVKSIVGDEKSVLPVSTLLTNYNGVSDICLSVPCIVGRDGVESQLKLKFNKTELRQFKNSASKLKKAMTSLPSFGRRG